MKKSKSALSSLIFALLGFPGFFIIQQIYVYLAVQKHIVYNVNGLPLAIIVCPILIFLSLILGCISLYIIKHSKVPLSGKRLAVAAISIDLLFIALIVFAILSFAHAFGAGMQ